MLKNDAHGIKKLLLKTQVSLTSFLHSEVNQIIHIIVHDQDGKNNNISLMSERPFISSALGGRPSVPYPNAATALGHMF